MPDLQDAVYVYGVSPKSEYAPVAVHGVEDAEVGAVEHAGLVALASRVETGNLAARDVRAHWRVLEQAFERGTVLPVRFGTVMESEEAVRVRLLEPNADQLSGLLEQMAGLVQLNLKGRYDEDRLLREIVCSSPAVARMRERVRSRPEGAAPPAEQIALGQLVEREIAQRQADDGATARRRLDPFAVAVREDEVGHPNAFNIAFLVSRDRVDAFSEAVGSLRGEFGERIEIRYVGPVPPFSFAETDLNVEGQGWG